MLAPAVPAAQLQAAVVNAALASALAAALAFSSLASAQVPPEKTESQESSWGLGLAVVSIQRSYRGVDREVLGVPILSFENEYVNLIGPSLEVKLPGCELSDSQRLKFGLIFNFFRGSGGYEAKDSPYLSGMAERDPGFWAGVKMGWETDLVDAKLEWTTDVSGNSKGQVLNLNLEHSWMLGKNATLIPKVGVEWVDSRYVNYYYGVNANEATAWRRAYSGKATFNGEIGLTGIYRFDENHSTMLDVSAKWLGKEIKNSPIVDSSNENSVMLGYLYRF